MKTANRLGGTGRPACAVLRRDARGASTASIRVTKISSRRSASTAASTDAAARSPATGAPERVRPAYRNVVVIALDRAHPARASACPLRPRRATA